MYEYRFPPVNWFDEEGMPRSCGGRRDSSRHPQPRNTGFAPPFQGEIRRQAGEQVLPQGTVHLDLLRQQPVNDAAGRTNADDGRRSSAEHAFEGEEHLGFCEHRTGREESLHPTGPEDGEVGIEGQARSESNRRTGHR